MKLKRLQNTARSNAYLSPELQDVTTATLFLLNNPNLPAARNAYKALAKKTEGHPTLSGYKLIAAAMRALLGVVATLALATSGAGVALTFTAGAATALYTHSIFSSSRKKDLCKKMYDLENAVEYCEFRTNQ